MQQANRDRAAACLALSLLLGACERAPIGPPPEPEGSERISIGAVDPAPRQASATPAAQADAETDPAGSVPPDPGVVADGTGAWTREYIVRPGDSLWIVTQDALGDGNRWMEVYQANRDVIGPNPNGVRAGMRLRLPDR